MKNTKALVIALFLLCGITVFSVIKFFLLQQEKQELLKKIDVMNIRVVTLQNEKQRLTQEVIKEKELQRTLSEQNAQLNNNLNITQDQLTKISADLKEAQKTIERLGLDFSALRTENEILRSQGLNLQAQVNQISQEKDTLQAKFNSVDELKKAIKELKKKKRTAKEVLPSVLPAATASELKKNSKKPYTVGNRGFLILNGQSTYPARVKIEVTPVPVE